MKETGIDQVLTPLVTTPDVQGKKTILLIIDSPLSLAPRAQTMIRALKDEFQLTVAAMQADQEAGYTFEELKLCKERRQNFHFRYPWLLRKTISAGLIFLDRITQLTPSYYFQKKIWNRTNKARVRQFANRQFDAIICHHAHNLPVAVCLAKKMNATVFFNAHEYYPREFDNDMDWVKQIQPTVKYICQTYLKSVTTCFTAAQGYARAYEENYQLPCMVIPCVKPYFDLYPGKVNGKIRIVHQGYANPDRKIETMIEMCNYLDERFELYLYLMPTAETYFEFLKTSVARKKNVFLLPPVSPEQLVVTLNQYDIGLYILEPTNFNTTHMLPNKTFEFVQARLMTAISPAKGMIPYVEQYELGIIAPDHSAKSMAEKLNALTQEDIIRFKNNAHKAARAMSAENYYPLIRKEVAKCFA